MKCFSCEINPKCLVKRSTQSTMRGIPSALSSPPPCSLATCSINIIQPSPFKGAAEHASSARQFISLVIEQALHGAREPIRTQHRWVSDAKITIFPYSHLFCICVSLMCAVCVCVCVCVVWTGAHTHTADS